MSTNASHYFQRDRVLKMLQADLVLTMEAQANVNNTITMRSAYRAMRPSYPSRLLELHSFKKGETTPMNLRKGSRRADTDADSEVGDF